MIGTLNIKLLRDLWAARGQGLATALLVACGVAVYVMSAGTLQSLQATRDAYYERYRFADVFAQLKRAPLGLASAIGAIPGVKWVQTRIVHLVTLELPGVREPATGRLVSLPVAGRPVLNDLVLRAGRWPAPGRPDEVIVNEAFAEANRFRPGDGFRAIVNGHLRELRLVGVALSPEFVYTLGPGSLVPDNRRFGVVWMSRDAMEAAFDMKQGFNDVSLGLARHARPAAVRDRLDALLAPYGGLGAYARDEQLSHQFLSGELDQLRSMGRTIPPIFLAVAAFLLHVLASRLVDLERGQIGLLKAFGYGGASIGWHYLKLIGLMVLAGVVLGSVAGIELGRLMTGLYQQFYRFPFLYFRLEPAVFLVAAGGSLGAGALAAVSAVRRAVRLPPAVAMRPAPPANYRGGLPDRALSLLPLSQPGRMIARHLVRWPLRSLLTGLGFAMSVALMVGTLFFFDATERLLDDVFHLAHRQDVTVMLQEPVDPVVVGEIARLPGVLAAEGHRTLAVRLRLGHLGKRTAIEGIVADGRMVRLLDGDRQAMAPPGFGLLLGARLAQVLRAGRGDLVDVEVLEGRRAVRRLPVVGLVEDHIGTGAYMRQDALDRLAGEGPRVSVVDLRIDGNAEAGLYARLKRLPQVAGATLWRVALQGFRETMAESVRIVVLFYVGFGSAIAFGVAYNSGRIALSERGRELASLRVLGFTQLEVAYILLGELALLALLALPVGCVVGYGLAWLLAHNLASDLFRIPLVVAPATYAIACAAALAAAALSGLLVWRRIGRLDLIAVLKTQE